MEILEIQSSKLKDMRAKQGVVVCGCCGDINDWANTISKMIEKEDILKENNRIEKCFLFDYCGAKHLALIFNTNRINAENFDTWWRKNNAQYGTIKLSTFVRCRMGGFNPKVIKQEMPKDKTENVLTFCKVKEELVADVDVDGQIPESYGMQFGGI